MSYVIVGSVPGVVILWAHYVPSNSYDHTGGAKLLL